MDAQLADGAGAWATLIQEPAAWVGVFIVLTALAAAVPFAQVVRRATASE